jgi:hypothetical protein
MQPKYQWIQAVFRGGIAPNVEVKSEWIYTSTPPSDFIVHVSLYIPKHF